MAARARFGSSRAEKLGNFGKSREGRGVGSWFPLSLSLYIATVLNGGPVYGHCALAHGAIKARIEWRAERPSAISQGMKH